MKLINMNQLLKYSMAFNKAAQQGSDVPSVDVTITVRASINDYFEKIKFSNILQQNILTTATTEADKGREVHGNFKITGFLTNASIVNGKWKIDPKTSGLKFNGTLLSDKTMGPAIKKLITQTNLNLINLLEARLAKLAPNWTGTKITNNDTDISEITAEV